MYVCVFFHRVHHRYNSNRDAVVLYWNSYIVQYKVREQSRGLLYTVADLLFTCSCRLSTPTLLSLSSIMTPFSIFLIHLMTALFIFIIYLMSPLSISSSISCPHSPSCHPSHDPTLHVVIHLMTPLSMLSSIL